MIPPNPAKNMTFFVPAAASKGASDWTLGQEYGRDRAQGCFGLDPWPGKGAESCPGVLRNGPLARNMAGTVPKGASDWTLGQEKGRG